MYEYFSQKGVLLQQEGELIHSCLKTGLLILQDANLDFKGDYYLAFFLLSTGLERLMKVIIIIEHMASNKLNTPSSSQIRGYGHDLRDLFRKCSQIAADYSVSEFNDFSSDDINRSILEFLSEFARRTRYHNLDSIAGAGVSRDPLSQWHTIVEKIAQADISGQERLQAEVKGRMLGTLLSSYTIFICHDFEQKLASPDDLYATANLIALTMPYCIARIFAIIVSLDSLLSVVTTVAQSVDLSLGNSVISIPFMSEFLEFARYPDPELWRLPNG